MTKRQAKRVAHAVVANLLQHWQMGADPDEFESLTREDKARVDKAIDEIFLSHEARGDFILLGPVE